MTNHKQITKPNEQTQGLSDLLFRSLFILIWALVYFLNGTAARGQEASTFSSFLSPEGKISFGDTANSILVIDYPENLQRIEEYIKMIDRPPLQVLIEARVVEVKLSGEHSLGVNWRAFQEGGKLPSFGGFNLSGAVTPAAISQGIPFKSTLLPPLTVTGTAESPFTIAIFDDNMNTIIRTLANSLDTNILSAPRVSVINNYEAEIKVVRELRWVVPTLQSNDGVVSVSFTEPEDSPREVGITLRVTPMITEDGEISLDLNPEVSEHVSNLSLTSSIGTNEVGYTIPIVDTRTAWTKVIIGNRKTLIIGGLISEKLKKETSKVPLLGDIPVLGYLFKSTKDTHDKSELLIFVSPTIINPNIQSEMAKKEDKFWYKEKMETIAPPETPGHISETTPQANQPEAAPQTTRQEIPPFGTPAEAISVTPPSPDNDGKKIEKEMAVEEEFRRFMKEKQP